MQDLFLSLVQTSSFTGAVLYAVALAILAYLATRSLHAFITFSLKHDTHHRLDRTTLLFLQQLGRIMIWVLAFTLYAHLIPALNRVGTALLTGVSVASVVIGLAAQNTLGNMVAGIALLIYRPFSVGDVLQVPAPTGNTTNNTETGRVESVSLGYTILQTFDNRRVVIPNSVVASQTTINLTSFDPKAMAILPITIGYKADLDKSRSILMELAKTHPSTLEVVGCPVTELGESGVTLSLRVWCKDSGAAGQLETDLYEAVKKRFDEAGIEIPYTYTNVIVHDKRLSTQ
jgi:small conductance mechanosensitive channel